MFILKVDRHHNFTGGHGLDILGSSRSLDIFLSSGWNGGDNHGDAFDGYCADRCCDTDFPHLQVQGFIKA